MATLEGQEMIPNMPDIAIDIKTPDRTYRELRKRAEYYLANGSKQVWCILSEKRLVEVYEPNKDVVILNKEDTLEGGELLPGFKLPVADIFKV
jgi:Uma2 family endonuclease